MKNPAFLSLLFIVSAGIFAGCATTSMMSFVMSQEEKDYLDKANNQPVSFSLSKNEEKEAWSRAQRFVSTYSPGPVAVVTDVIIQTNTSRTYDYNYVVNKSESGDSVGISVKCNYFNIMNKGDADQNAHILAYYMKTGDWPPKDRLVRR